MDSGNLIAFLKKFSFGRLIACGITLRVVIAIIDGVFGLEINELENFLNYKTFKFKLSKLQKIFNYISLITLVFSICFITYYLIKKIISNKSRNEQNY